MISVFAHTLASACCPHTHTHTHAHTHTHTHAHTTSHARMQAHILTQRHIQVLCSRLLLHLVKSNSLISPKKKIKMCVIIISVFAPTFATACWPRPQARSTPWTWTQPACVCVCVCVCARARVRVCVCVCVCVLNSESIDQFAFIWDWL